MAYFISCEWECGGERQMYGFVQWDGLYLVFKSNLVITVHVLLLHGIFFWQDALTIDSMAIEQWIQSLPGDY